MIAKKLFVPSVPQGKARPRATAVGGFARVYTPSTTKLYENLIKIVYQRDYPNEKPTSEPISLELVFRFPYPKSAYWVVNSKHNGELRSEWKGRKFTSKPDIDNLMKAVFDGLNGVAYKDDSQIRHVSASKVYDEKPGVEITILTEPCHAESE